MDKVSESIAEETGRGNIHGETAKVDGHMTRRVSYYGRSALGGVVEGMKGLACLGVERPKRESAPEYQFTRYLASNVLSKPPSRGWSGCCGAVRDQR